MSKTQITPFKLARYKEILTGPVRPVHWDVDPSTVCDHTCRDCPYIYEDAASVRDPMLGVLRPETAKNKRTLLNSGVFALFVAEAAAYGAKAITFVGGGEPTLHPRFVDMMDVVRGHGLKFGVITHLGRKYSPAFFDALSHATWVRVSVNAGTRETYLKHQGKDHFTQALANMLLLRQYVDLKPDKSTPRIGMSFLITQDNWQELKQAAALAQTWGAHYIQIKPIIESPIMGTSYKGLEAQITEALREVKTLETEDFQVVAQWTERWEELRRHERGEFSGRCHVPRFNPKLGANGVVYTCCELAYSDEGALGSIYDESLKTILGRAGQSCMEMKACPHCWDKPLNTIINDGKIDELQPPPESVDQEFV